MNRRVQKLWDDALLSGNYRQGRGGLRREGNDGTIRFCGLGVLSDLHRQEMGGEWSKQFPMQKGFEYLGSSAILSKEVMEWAGLTRDDEGWFVNMNDSLLYDFREIAKEVRRLS